MAKAVFHAQSSVRRYGGKIEDYLDIHVLMDASKSVIADNRHRILTHQNWFISQILPKIFGNYMVVPTTNAGVEIQAEIEEHRAAIAELQQELVEGKHGRIVSISQIGEDHILEDFAGKFIPTAGDYMQGMKLEGWMNNAKNGVPPSYEGLPETKKTVRTITLD
jgi:hypothetical protein